MNQINFLFPSSFKLQYLKITKMYVTEFSETLTKASSFLEFSFQFSKILKRLLHKALVTRI